MTRTDMALLISVAPRDRAIRNQTKLVQLLRKAHPGFTTSSQIERVILRDGTALTPERDQIVVGYTVRARVEPSGFTLEAQPVEFGKTGLFSFFRDRDGVIRFNASGERVGPGSRPFNQSQPE